MESPNLMGYSGPNGNTPDTGQKANNCHIATKNVEVKDSLPHGQKSNNDANSNKSDPSNASSVDGEHHHTGKVWNTNILTERFRVNRRRIAQEILQTLGRTEPSDDSHYIGYRARFLDVLGHLKSVIAHLQEYRQIMGSFCRVCSQLGSEVLTIVDPVRIGCGSDAELFSRAMISIDSRKEVRQGYHSPDDAVTAAIHSLTKKLVAMERHKKKMNIRDNLKLDYDGYERKLRTLRNSKKIDEAKIKIKEEKMNVAKKAMDETTEELFKIFAHYEARRETMISVELELFRQTQEEFFTRGLKASTFQMKHIDGTTDIYKEQEDYILQQMRSTTFANNEGDGEGENSTDIRNEDSTTNEHLRNQYRGEKDSHDSSTLRLQPPLPKCVPPPSLWTSLPTNSQDSTNDHVLGSSKCTQDDENHSSEYNNYSPPPLSCPPPPPRSCPPPPPPPPPPRAP